MAERLGAQRFTETVVRIFHEVDRHGQRFRVHPTLESDTPAGDLSKFVDLKKMQKVVGGVFNFFEDCESALREVSFTLSDMRSSGY